ncbi:MAG: hypothetical protein D6698_08095, partial [Gammaproteobacteria bacterium]
MSELQRAKQIARYASGQSALRGNVYEDKEAYTRLYTAVLALTERSPFWARVFATIRFIELPGDHLEKTPEGEKYSFIMATDGRNIYYNAHFVNHAHLRQVLFVVLHEAYHVALDHIGTHDRFAKAEYPKLVNYATDFVINGDIIKDFGESALHVTIQKRANTKDPKTGKPINPLSLDKTYEVLVFNKMEDNYTGLYSTEFIGKSAEEVYEILKERMDQQDQLPQMGGGHVIVHPESSNPTPPKGSKVFRGGDENEKDQQKGSDNEEGANGNENGKEDDQGESQQNGQQGDQPGDAQGNAGPLKAGDGWIDEDGNIHIVVPDSEMENIRESAKDAVTGAIADAKNNGSGAGSVPAAIARVFDKWHRPKGNWRAVVRNFTAKMIRPRYSFMRPHKKRGHLGVALPSCRNPEKYIDMAIAVDTSGSIDSAMLSKAFGEISGILRSYPSFKVHI